MKHNEALRLLKVAKGQIDSVVKMTEDDRYCIDISNQIQATVSLLQKAQSIIIAEHLKACVVNSIQAKDVDHKIDEIASLIQNLISKK